jgi:hypothetical protein
MSLLVDKTSNFKCPSNAYQKNDVAFKITIERLIDQIVIFFLTCSHKSGEGGFELVTFAS